MIYRIISIQYIYNKKCRIVYIYEDKNGMLHNDYVICSYKCSLLNLRNIIEHRIIRSYYE